jgi:hypothetical protein
MDAWIGLNVAGLIAVYRTSDQIYADENNPTGKLAIMFLQSNLIHTVVLQIESGGIVRIDSVIGSSPQTIIDRDADGVILAPPG